MTQIIEIKPGIGINNLNFGFSIQEVENILGKPDDIDLLDELIGCQTTLFHYWESGFSLFFDENNDQLFCSVETDNTNALLWGEQVFDLNEKQVIELLNVNGHVLFESELHEWGEKRISFTTINMDFYFKKDKLIAINYGKKEISPPIIIHPN